MDVYDNAAGGSFMIQIRRAGTAEFAAVREFYYAVIDEMKAAEFKPGFSSRRRVRHPLGMDRNEEFDLFERVYSTAGRPVCFITGWTELICFEVSGPRVSGL